MIWNQISDTFNSMGWALIGLFSLYLLLPTLVTAIILKFFRISGPIHKFLVGIVGLVGMYYMFTHGIQELLSKLQ